MKRSSAANLMSLHSVPVLPDRTSMNLQSSVANLMSSVDVCKGFTGFRVTDRLVFNLNWIQFVAYFF